LFEHGLLGKPGSTFPDHARILFLSIFSEDRFPFFPIMLGSLFEHDLLGKPILIFPNHAVSLSMILSDTGIHFPIMLL